MLYLYDCLRQAVVGELRGQLLDIRVLKSLVKLGTLLHACRYDNVFLLTLGDLPTPLLATFDPTLVRMPRQFLFLPKRGKT